MEDEQLSKRIREEKRLMQFQHMIFTTRAVPPRLSLKGSGIHKIYDTYFTALFDYKFISPKAYMSCATGQKSEELDD